MRYLKIIIIIFLFVIPIGIVLAQNCPETPSPTPSSAVCNPAPGWFISYGDNSFPSVIGFIIKNILLPVVGIITVVFIIIGGFRYITARGDEEAAASGKKILTNAIIGLVIVILSYIMVIVVINALLPQGAGV
jgi:hypothetical protein